MTAAPRQLVFDLAHRQALGAEDFLVSSSNEAAVETIDRWPNWPHPASIVVGPQGSGKSHLANVWRLRSGAGIVTAAALDDTAVAALADGAGLVVEDLDRGIADEKALFHLLNRARESKLSVLLTSRAPPGEQEFRIPDLRSRLRALPLVTISPPDEALLKAVLVKHFADRQLNVEPHVINYIALHMEQSMEAAASIVAAIDKQAMAAHRKVTRALAGEVLGRQEEGGR